MNGELVTQNIGDKVDPYPVVRIVTTYPTPLNVRVTLSQVSSDSGTVLRIGNNFIQANPSTSVEYASTYNAVSSLVVSLGDLDNIPANNIEFSMLVEVNENV